MTTHPPSCPACHGCGWQNGPPIYETVDGQPHPYTTVTPCTHLWWDDDPDAD